jgi:hypothetical protein
MPINTGQQSVYVDDPDNMDVPSLYAPGHLGNRFTTVVPLRTSPGGPVAVSGASRSFQIVQVDSTLTTSPTRGQIMLWKDKTKYQVTPKVVNAINRNEVAGVMPGGASAGNYTCVQFRGPQYVQITAADQAAMTSGDSIVPSAADDGRGTRVAAGTAVTYTKVGTATGPNLSGLVLADLCVPETT